MVKDSHYHVVFKNRTTGGFYTTTVVWKHTSCFSLDHIVKKAKSTLISSFHSLSYSDLEFRSVART